MNKIILITLASALLLGCGKSNTPAPQNNNPTETKTGSLLSVKTNCTTSYNITITETSPAGGTLFHIDTIVTGPFTYEYHPKLNSNIHSEVDWYYLNKKPDYSISYNSVAHTDYNQGALGSTFYESVNFVAN